MLEKKIADKIHEIRKNKGLTLAQLGDATGLSKGLLSRIENSQVSPPIATLSKIARGLEVPIGIFFEEDEVYNQKDAEGFIRLNALRFIIEGEKQPSRAQKYIEQECDDSDSECQESKSLGAKIKSIFGMK